MSSATFRLGGDGLDPDEITRRLGIVPTETARKGTPIPTKRHPHLKERANVWIVRVDADGVPLETQVEQLLTRLEAARESLRDLSRQYDGIFWCLLGLEADENAPTVLQLSAEQVERIAALGAELCIEVMPYR